MRAEPLRASGSASVVIGCARPQYAFSPREQRERRLEQDVEVEQHRPVVDVVEVVLDALLDLLGGVGLAAPAVDLRPAGDAGLDLVAGEVAVDDVVVEPVGGLGLQRVRARADERQLAP